MMVEKVFQNGVRSRLKVWRLKTLLKICKAGNEKVSQFYEVNGERKRKAAAPLPQGFVTHFGPLSTSAPSYMPRLHNLDG